jgi:uncharacterized membrane protein
VRGIVMVLMALDHVKHYFSRDEFYLAGLGGDAVDLASQTTPAQFFTRWVTHFCAPTFVFLAGTSAFLYGTRGKSKAELCWFLFSRGVWLILLEVTVVNWSWAFKIDYTQGMGGGVIWAIGSALVVLSVLIWLPTAAVAAIGVSIIAFHNLLDHKTAEEVGIPFGVWSTLQDGGGFFLLPNVQGLLPDPTAKYGYKILLTFATGYRLLAWAGVVAAGYGFGALFLLDRPERRRQLIGLGLVLTLLFVGLRYTNYFGDLRYPAGPWNPSQDVSGQPGPWSRYDNPWFTLLSFLNTQKYPPSLLFLLMTLGPAITAIGLFDRDVTGPISRFFITFGRVPLFYYLLHLPLIHALAVGVDYLRYRSSPVLHDGPWAPAEIIRKDPGLYPDYGFPLPVVYLIWIGVVLLLYPFCWWFARVKQRYRNPLLSYL